MPHPLIEFKNDTGINFFPNSRINKCAFTELHTHSVIEILYFTEGLHKIICDDKEYLCEVGDMFLVRSYSSHQIFSLGEKSNVHYVMQIAPHFIHSIADSNFASSYLIALSFSYNNEKCLWKKNENEKSGITNVFAKLISEFKNQNVCYDIAKCIYTSTILFEILNNHNSDTFYNTQNEDLKRRIYDTMIFVQRNFGSDISAKECARNVSLSLYYFSRSFKAITGHTFKEYLNLVRIIQSNQFLITTDLPINEIASLCGFNSTAYFILIYKKIQNTTPLAFRKDNRNLDKLASSNHHSRK